MQVDQLLQHEPALEDWQVTVPIGALHEISASLKLLQNRSEGESWNSAIASFESLIASLEIQQKPKLVSSDPCKSINEISKDFYNTNS